MSPIRSVAVLGGGISGLSTVYYLTRALPRHVPITIYESSKRLGGYIQSTQFVLPSAHRNTGDDHVLFEHGPRTLRVSKRVSSVNIFDLIRRLNLIDELILVPKQSRAAKNRYIFYDGRINMIPYSVPSMLQFYFSQPLFRGMLLEVLREPFRQNRPKAAVETNDESIGSFMTRRFGPRITERLISAAIHGIYAGDINLLSVKSILEYLWKRETTWGSVLPIWKRRTTLETKDPYSERHKEHLKALLEDNKEFMDSLQGTSIVSFRHGMQSLVDRLQEEVLKSGNVTVRYDDPVRHLENVVDGITVTSAKGAHTYSHVFSALPSRTLAELTEPPLAELLRKIPSVSVNVVNLFFSKPRLLPVTGFGYLLPKAVPREDNPERALGVVFDSDAVSRDHGEGAIPGSFQDSVDGTKLTVMLGGHWWNEEMPVKQHDKAIALARQLISRQIGVNETPVLAQATFQENCIPQYVVGHHANLRAIHEAVLAQFNGKLILTGASFLGVSVNDCVYNARIAVEDTVARNGKGISGLEAKALYDY
ncbi:hypothetical protein POJ06DRAFT_26456 [Lipomyces tetrasporus]|uniref:Protoporphyrinogen oxidase n=1 Tax=Lipomyces tetrasporus TaxID=54092 RepID=A0AAD7VPN6_9ASCO|nr:uncharacterized protein POJ06DRAFT_26456 [Lipomyces tetrasporus]KAJ8097987.1 hypothetical protein POJ06DRAFT_26456 [Lipomyces tetrasporus]